MNERLVLPVIHHHDALLSADQAELAFRAGADGVFLISHVGQDTSLFTPAQAIKAAHPEKWVGLNLLATYSLVALLQTERLHLDAIWWDDAGVSSRGLTPEGTVLRRWIPQSPLKRCFGSVAFKYRPHEPDPPEAVRLARDAHMVPTTSGEATGSPPSLDKVRAMALAAEWNEAATVPQLAVASGMTPENVKGYTPWIGYYLVATGVALRVHGKVDPYRFDEERLKRFVEEVKGAPYVPHGGERVHTQA